MNPHPPEDAITPGDQQFAAALVALEAALVSGQRPPPSQELEQLPAEDRQRLARAQSVLQLLDKAVKGDSRSIAAAQTTLVPVNRPRLPTPQERQAARDINATPRPPRVPGYELLRVLGRGGMGIVYLANDLRLQRLVAVKILADTECGVEDLQRFRNEGEAAAQLQHPNVVQVYAVGQYRDDDGLEWPFLAMEYVEGQPLDRRLQGQPQPPRQAAELLEVVARGIAFAHAKGIVHRDLKPANILLQAHGTSVGGFGVPKISDFGLAKRLAVATLSQTGCAIGTPAYMAPEQAQGRTQEIRPPTDVYALGAMLYEMLTGRPPFTGMQPMDLLLRVIYEEPIPPSSLQPNVPGDLETICLKCLQKDPHRRYPHANDLADELRRFLNGEPIRARPANLVERGWRWARRHRSVAALSALMLCVVLGSFTAMALLYVHAEGQRRQLEATAEALRLEEQATRTAWEAERQRRAQVRHALDTVSTRLIDAWTKQRDQPAEVRAVQESLLAQYEAFARDQGTDQADQVAAAQAWNRCGVLCRLLRRESQALEAFRQAVAQFVRLHAEQPDQPDYAAQLQTNRFHLAQQLHDLGKLAEAEQAYQEVLTQAGLTPAAQSPLAERLARGRAHFHLGRLHYDQRRESKAEASWQQGQALAAQLLQEFPAQTEVADLLTSCARRQARLLMAQGRQAEACQQFERTLALWLKLAADHPGLPYLRHRLGSEYHELGTTLDHLGRLAESEIAFRQAVEALSTVTGGARTTMDFRDDQALAHLNFAYVLTSLSRHVEARDTILIAVDMLRKLAVDYPKVTVFRTRLGAAYNTLALTQWGLGKLAEAEEGFRKALAVQEPLVAEDKARVVEALDLGGTCCNFGNMLSATNRAAESLPLYDQAIATLTPLLALPNGPANARRFLANSYIGRARSLGKLQRPEHALRDWDQALVYQPETQQGSTRIERARALALSGTPGGPGEAFKEANTLAMHPASRKRGSILVQLAGICALAAGAVKPPAADGYAARALSLLNDAFTLGAFADKNLVKELETSADFAALRARPDFQKLLATLAR